MEDCLIRFRAFILATNILATTNSETKTLLSARPQPSRATPLLYVVGPPCRPPFALSAGEASRPFVHHFLKVTGTFGPDTTAAMKAAEQKLRVLEIDEHFKPTPSSRSDARFQLLLVPNCTSNVHLVEGRNVWWVRTNTRQKYSTLAFSLSSS
jgi:hypothetical protein